MTTQPTFIYFDQALREEYSKPENAWLQAENILLGILRFTATFTVHTLALLSAWVLLLLAFTPDTLPLLSPLIETRVEHNPPFDKQELILKQASAPDSLERAKEPAAVSDISEVSESVKVQGVYPKSSHAADLQEEAHTLLKNLLRIAALAAFLVGAVCNTGKFRWVYRDLAWARVHEAQALNERLEVCRQAASFALARQHDPLQAKAREGA